MIVALFGFVIGAIFGSFGDVVANRLIANKSIWGRSYCLSCKKTLKWYDLFPFFSFLLLRGRCRYCHKKIAPEHFYVESGMGLLVALYFGLTPFSLATIGFNFLTALLLLKIVMAVFIILISTIVFITDLKTGYIFDKITYPAVGIALLLQVAISAVQTGYFYTEFQKSPLAKYLMLPNSTYLSSHYWLIWQPTILAIGLGVLLAAFFAALIILTKGRGMGWGDVKYVLFIGLALGFPNGLLAVFLAFFSGAFFGVALLLIGKKQFGQTIPFGPFLSLGTITALVWGNQIMDWYLHLGR